MTLRRVAQPVPLRVPNSLKASHHRPPSRALGLHTLPRKAPASHRGKTVDPARMGTLPVRENAFGNPRRHR